MQTWAIFVNAYRSLNAKKMFWIVMILSGVLVAAFACVGVNDNGIKILMLQIDNSVVNAKQTPPAEFYKGLFVVLGIQSWLGWLAIILALISTAGIFPDLIANGSIEMVLSKPMGRLRLFFTQYLAGLMFVTFQVVVFTAASFLVIGWRGGAWELALFVAIPIVVCFFSYLFCVCVLFGILTRSTLASLLLTFLCWAAFWVIGTAEETTRMFVTLERHHVSLAELSAESRSKQNPSVVQVAQPPTASTAADEQTAEQSSEPSASWLARVHEVLYVVKTALPKTSETQKLLENCLMDMAKLPNRAGTQQNPRAAAAIQEVVEDARRRSVAWIVGTSLGFETVVLAAAAWVFCRRDF